MKNVIPDSEALDLACRFANYKTVREKMEYILVKWKHNNVEYPVLLYSELDNSRFETRKVEIFYDGEKVMQAHPKNLGQHSWQLNMFQPFLRQPKNQSLSQRNNTRRT